MNDGMYVYGGDTGMVNDNSGTGDTGSRNIGDEHSAHWADDDNRKYYCYDDDFSISSLYGSAGTLIGFGRDGHSLPVPDSGFPEGMWELRMDDTAIAEFDFAVGSPVNSDSKITTVPVPAIKVNYLPTAGTLTSVEIEWFQYNPATDKYEKMSDTQRAAFEDSYMLLNSVFDIQEHTPADISFYPPESQPHYQNKFITFEDLTVYDQTWYLPGSAGDNGTNYAADSISVQMEMGGVHYLFGWD